MGDLGTDARGAAVPAAVFAVVLTVVLVVLDVGGSSGRGDGQVALDTAAGTTGVLLGLLLYGRFRVSCLVRDALLSAFLFVLGAANAVFGVLPPIVDDGAGRLTAASAVAGLAAGVLFALAVWLPAWAVPVRWRGRAPALLAVLTVSLLLVAAGVAAALPREGTGSADTFGSTTDPFLAVAQVLAAAAFAAAAFGWMRPHTRTDRIAPAMACAGVLGAASRIDFAAAGTSTSSWFTAGMVLRCGFYTVLLVAALVEIRAYWADAGAVAALEERRRMARDLHDGLAQELAFAATQARALGERSEHPTRARLVAAATERALDESRRAIAALTRPLDEPLSVALAQCAEEVCERFDAKLVLHVAPTVTATPEVREALLRIVREAISNAVRHGGATRMHVSLRQDRRGLHLLVADDGAGFDVEDRKHLSGRFGLVSMQERAEALGGSMSVTSSRPGGTSVRVRLP